MGDSSRRTRTTATALAALLALTAAPAAAQRTARTLWDDVRHAGEDILWVWSAPAHGDAKEWATAAAVAGASALTLLLDAPVDRWVVRDSASILHRGLRPLREDFSPEWLGDLGTGRILNPLNGALYVAGFIADDPKLRDAGMGCFATQQASSIFRHAVVYRLLPRARPSSGGDPRRWRVNGKVWRDTPWEEHSFFGGHVANAAGCAAFFTRRFELGAAEPALFAIAGGIGVARLLDRRHWLSDEVIGAAIGYAMGKAVADRQLRRRAEKDAEEPQIGVTRLGWTIRF